MIDVNEMRRKFPAKNPKGKRARDAAIKQIARDYERRKAELNGLKAPEMKKGVVFYVVVLLGLMLLASVFMTLTGKGGKARISKDAITVRKSLDALAIALGRYHYHTGQFPTEEEGLFILASTQVVKAGWNGPYIHGGRILRDPWKHDYVYIPGGDGAAPSLFSMGPDGMPGTNDDILANPALFDEPFRDTTWTKDWVPYRLRGIIVAPDEETKRLVERQVRDCLAATARAIGEEERRHAAFAASKVDEGAMYGALAAMTAGNPVVHIVSHWTYPEAQEGSPVTLTCYTLGDEAELFVNLHSQGRKRRAAEGEPFTWSVPYEPGEAKVIAYRDGMYIGEDSVRTAFRPVAVALVATKSLGDDEDGYAQARLVDDDGVVFPKEDAAFDFALDGPGEVSLRDGAAIAFRRTVRSGEPLKLTATCEGMRPATVTIPWKTR